MSGPMVVTFGCRLNAFESEVMKENAKDKIGDGTVAGVTGSDTPDTIIVNTCAVTAEAERQGRQTIRKLRRKHPQARIVVTGCAVQVSPDKFAAMPEIDQILGNHEKMIPENLQAPPPERVVVSDIMEVRETAGHLIGGFEGRTRAFIEVQQGCDHRCTFCIIPYGRGPSRSVPPDRVITQIRQLVDQGYGEVVLTGVDVTSYGGDTGSELSLGGLVLKILREVPDLARLRLSSLDPVEVDADLLRAVAEEERLMPHFHLSVQAGDDLILKRMKRRHLSGDVRELAGRLRDLRPGTVLGADVIVGFPTETDEMFQNSMRLVDDAGLTHLHVFPFSARAGTPAARMKKVPGDVVAQRSAALRAKGDAAMAALVQSKLGQTVKVLVEDDSRGFCEHYLPVRVSGDAAAGTLITATVTGISGGVLQA